MGGVSSDDHQASLEEGEYVKGLCIPGPMVYPPTPGHGMGPRIPPPNTDTEWWLPKHVPLAGGWDASYWNAFLLINDFLWTPKWRRQFYFGVCVGKGYCPLTLFAWNWCANIFNQNCNNRAPFTQAHKIYFTKIFHIHSIKENNWVVAEILCCNFIYLNNVVHSQWNDLLQVSWNVKPQTLEILWRKLIELCSPFFSLVLLLGIFALRICPIMSTNRMHF